MRILHLQICLLLAVYNSSMFSQADTAKADLINFHFQQTTIIQGHPSFSAPYGGRNSLINGPESQTSLTSTLFFGLKMLDGAEIYINPELAGGKGLSGTTGMAGFPNGEIYRVSNPEPVFSMARFFIRLNIGLGGKSIHIADSPNQLQSFQDSRRIMMTLGKFSLSDIFDDNSYSHDARNQFMNWALMSSVAWDYPADTKGYTYAFAVEYGDSGFAFRAAAAMVPKEANGMEMDTNIKNAYGIVLEFEKSFLILGRRAISRLLFYENKARMGSYIDAVSNPVYSYDITGSERYGRTKIGFAFNNEYSISENTGAFLKFSWNDGQTETWAFTEVDRAVSFGMTFGNMRIIRNSDEIGTAIAVNGLSEIHKEYLAKGGYGFIIGDGAMDYSPETIAEIYYKTLLFEHLTFTADYQLVVNPACNHDRGPVHIFSLRTHLEF